MPWSPPAHWTPKELRLWRAEHNLQFLDAAQLFGVHPSTYAYWEHTREPRDIDARMIEAETMRLKQLDPRIKPGESFVLRGQENDWYRIGYNDGEGYVSSAYVTIHS